MEIKNLKDLKSEINYLEEAEELLKTLYYGFGPYGLKNIIKGQAKEFITFPGGADMLVVKLDNHFNFDDSE